MDPLSSLAVVYQTDKVRHGFCAFYHSHLASIRQDVRKVLEIGVWRGASLRMWRDYFLNAVVHGFDQHVLPGPLPDRIQLHQGDQASRESLRQLLQATGSEFDLILDDGGHTMAQQQVSLGALFPHLRPGGLSRLELGAGQLLNQPRQLLAAEQLLGHRSSEGHPQSEREKGEHSVLSEEATHGPPTRGRPTCGPGRTPRERLRQKFGADRPPDQGGGGVRASSI